MKCNKVVFIATTARGHLNVFHTHYIKLFKEKGWEVHAICNGDAIVPFVDKQYNVSIMRTPFSFNNIKALSDITKIMKNEKYDLVTCHTPMGGVLARIASKKACISHVIYTAHGFHFYKGAHAVNYIIYKNMERFLARYTDALVTINHEDYESAQKFNVRKGGKVYYIPGIGVDIKGIEIYSVSEKRAELGIRPDDLVILATGELIKRKNFDTALKAFSNIKNNNSILLICGRGEEEENLKILAKRLKIENNVIFAGFRTDIKEIENVVDIFLFTSHQEGLSVALMESMAAGLPVVCSDIRGNSDLIGNGKGGYLINHNDADGFTMALEILLENEVLRKNMGIYNKNIIEKYSLENALKNMMTIYNEVLGEEL